MSDWSDTKINLLLLIIIVIGTYIGTAYSIDTALKL